MDDCVISMNDILNLMDTCHQDTRKLYEEKAKCYSSEKSALENFDRQSDLSGMTPFQIWSVFATKHDISIANAIRADPNNPVDRSEGMRSRVMDRIVYSFLLLALLERQERRKALCQQPES